MMIVLLQVQSYGNWNDVDEDVDHPRPIIDHDHDGFVAAVKQLAIPRQRFRGENTRMDGWLSALIDDFLIIISNDWSLI